MGRSPTSKVPAVRGRPFARGNPGRKPGSKNRNSHIVAALLDGELEGLTRKAIELGHGGDRFMLRLLLEPFLPRERLIKFDLPPLVYADDAVAALASIVREVTEGRLTPGEGAAVAELVN